MRHFLFLLSVVGLFSSCASQYRIAGNTSVPMLDGKMLYLKTVSTIGSTHNIDSCEVIHGKFSFMGLMDSTILAELYMGNESVMPLVIENGNLKVNINIIDQNVSGGSLNDRLYRFLGRKARLEEECIENNLLTSRLCQGVPTSKVSYDRCVHRGRELAQDIEQLEIQFIKENYDNVLGPGIFMLLCSQYPSPVMTPQIKAITGDAPRKFLSHPYVRKYLHTAQKRQNKVLDAD